MKIKNIQKPKRLKRVDKYSRSFYMKLDIVKFAKKRQRLGKSLSLKQTGIIVKKVYEYLPKEIKDLIGDVDLSSTTMTTAISIEENIDSENPESVIVANTFYDLAERISRRRGLGTVKDFWENFTKNEFEKANMFKRACRLLGLSPKDQFFNLFTKDTTTKNITTAHLNLINDNYDLAITLYEVVNRTKVYYNEKMKIFKSLNTKGFVKYVLMEKNYSSGEFTANFN